MVNKKGIIHETFYTIVYKPIKNQRLNGVYWRANNYVFHTILDPNNYLLSMRALRNTQERLMNEK